MFVPTTDTALPAALRERATFRLDEAASAWSVTNKTAWKRLSRMVREGGAYRLARGTYSGARTKPKLPDTAEALLSALEDLSAYRFAVTGLDVLTPYFHNLPARYPHLLLCEKRGILDLQRAVSQAKMLPVAPRVLASVWRNSPPLPVVAFKQTGNWHGVARDSRHASPERAFLDLLVETRLHQYPYPHSDLGRMWREFDPSLRRRIATLGRHLQVRPFYPPNTTSGSTDLLTIQL